MTSKSKADLPSMMQGLAVFNPEAAAKSLEMLSAGVQFMSMRMESSFAAQRALLSCQTPAEVYDVQSKYLQTAIEHYSMATQGMMEAFGTQMASGVISTKRGYDDVPL